MCNKCYPKGVFVFYWKKNISRVPSLFGTTFAIEIICPYIFSIPFITQLDLSWNIFLVHTNSSEMSLFTVRVWVLLIMFLFDISKLTNIPLRGYRILNKLWIILNKMRYLISYVITFIIIFDFNDIWSSVIYIPLKPLLFKTSVSLKMWSDLRLRIFPKYKEGNI